MFHYALDDMFHSTSIDTFSSLLQASAMRSGAPHYSSTPRHPAPYNNSKSTASRGIAAGAHNTCHHSTPKTVPAGMAGARRLETSPGPSGTASRAVHNTSKDTGTKHTSTVKKPTAGSTSTNSASASARTPLAASRVSGASGWQSAARGSSGRPSFGAAGAGRTSIGQPASVKPASGRPSVGGPYSNIRPTRPNGNIGRAAATTATPAAGVGARGARAAALSASSAPSGDNTPAWVRRLSGAGASEAAATHSRARSGARALGAGAAAEGVGASRTGMASGGAAGVGASRAGVTPGGAQRRAAAQPLAPAAGRGAAAAAHPPHGTACAKPSAARVGPAGQVQGATAATPRTAAVRRPVVAAKPTVARLSARAQQATAAATPGQPQPGDKGLPGRRYPVTSNQQGGTAAASLCDSPDVKPSPAASSSTHTPAACGDQERSAGCEDIVTSHQSAPGTFASMLGDGEAFITPTGLSASGLKQPSLTHLSSEELKPLPSTSASTRVVGLIASPASCYSMGITPSPMLAGGATPVHAMMDCDMDEVLHDDGDVACDDDSTGMLLALKVSSVATESGAVSGSEHGTGDALAVSELSGSASMPPLTNSDVVIATGGSPSASMKEPGHGRSLSKMHSQNSTNSDSTSISSTSSAPISLCKPCSPFAFVLLGPENAAESPCLRGATSMVGVGAAPSPMEISPMAVPYSTWSADGTECITSPIVGSDAGIIFGGTANGMAVTSSPKHGAMAAAFAPPAGHSSKVPAADSALYCSKAPAAPATAATGSVGSGDGAVDLKHHTPRRSAASPSAPAAASPLVATGATAVMPEAASGEVTPTRRRGTRPAVMSSWLGEMQGMLDGLQGDWQALRKSRDPASAH